MYCTKCGRENADGVKFCIHCGAMMEQPEPVNQETPAEPASAEQGAVSEMAEQPVSAEQPAPAEQPVSAEQSAPAEQSVSAEQPAPAEQPMSAEQPAPAEQSVSAEQPIPAEPIQAVEQPAPAEQPWMANQPVIVEQSWMGGQPKQTMENVPLVQMGQMPPMGQASVQGGQMPPMMGQVPMQGGQMPPMGQAPMQGGQMPMGQVPMQGGQMPPMGQVPMQGGQMPPMGQVPMQGGQIPPTNGQMPPMPYAAVPPAQPSQKKGNGAVKVVVGIIVALLIIGIGVLAFLFINKGSQEKKLQNQLETAANYRADGSYEEAIDAYLEILEKNPENSEAIDGLTNTYIEWAERYAKDENYEEAISILKGADDHAKSKTIKKAISEYEEALEALNAANNEGFTDADLVFRNGSEEVTVERDHALIVRSSGVSYCSSYVDGSYEEYGALETSRGLKLGDSLEDYLSLYTVESGYSAWELYSGDNNEYTSFAEYEGQSPATMYESYNNVWLDIGFSKENGEWRALTDREIRDTWFCEAPLSDYEEVIVFAVNFDSWGEVVGISCEYFSYNEVWVEWQAWDNGTDSGNGDSGNGSGDYSVPEYDGNKEEFTDADLMFYCGSDSTEVSLNHSFIVYADGSQIISYVDAERETTEDVYVTNRGLALGMTLEDYKNLYFVEPGYAAWELFRGENNEYTSFAEYTGQDPFDMYDGTYNNAWLDIGFCKENGEWRALRDYEVQDTWFCDANLDDYEEVVVFAVNLDQWGEIRGLSLEHFTYDDGWVEWQGWAN